MYNGNPVSIVESWVYLWRIKIKWDDFFSLHTIYYVIYNKIKKFINTIHMQMKYFINQ